MADSEKAPEQQQEEQQQQEQTPIVPKETIGESQFFAVFRLAKWKMPVSHFVFPENIEKFEYDFRRIFQ